MICEKCKQVILEQLEKQKNQADIMTQQLLFLRGTIAVLETLLRGDENNADTLQSTDSTKD